MFNLEEIVEPQDIDVQNIKVNETLNPDIFEGDKVKASIRKKLLQTAKNFQEYCKIPDNVEVKDVLLLGSNANYNYSPQSDIDLHLVIDFNEMGTNRDLVEDYFKAKKKLWSDEFNIHIKEYDVECYVQDVSEQPSSAGMYSLMDDKWITKPIKEMIVLDKKKIQSKASDIVNQIEKIEAQPSVEKVDKLKEKLKKMRKSGLQSGGEYSIDNLVFKVLRNGKYLDKLDKIKQDKINHDLSIEEAKRQENDKEYELTREQLKNLVGKIVKARLNENFSKYPGSYSVEKCDIPDGQYDVIWSAYKMIFTLPNGEKKTCETLLGVRGTIDKKVVCIDGLIYAADNKEIIDKMKNQIKT